MCATVSVAMEAVCWRGCLWEWLYGEVCVCGVSVDDGSMDTYVPVEGKWVWTWRSSVCGCVGDGYILTKRYDVQYSSHIHVSDTYK